MYPFRSALPLALAFLGLAGCAAPEDDEPVDDGSAAVEVLSRSSALAEITQRLPFTFTTAPGWSQRFYEKERVKSVGMSMEMDCTLERLSGWSNEREIPGNTVYVVTRLSPRNGPQSNPRSLGVYGFVDEQREWNGKTYKTSANMWFACHMRKADVVPTWSAIAAAMKNGGGPLGLRGTLTPTASAP